MAKLSKAAVKEKIAEYAALVGRIDKCESAQNAELEPLLEKYDKAAKPIIAKHEKKLAPLIEQRERIAAEITAFFDAQESDIEISEAGYTGYRKTERKLMPRVIDVKKFIETAKKKGEAMYACLTVGVKKAEDLLGKEIDQISERPTKAEVVTGLRKS